MGEARLRRREERHVRRRRRDRRGPDAAAAPEEGPGDARRRWREERHVLAGRGGEGEGGGGGDESPWVMGETATTGRATKNLRHGCRESRAVGVEREEMMSGTPAEGLDKRERAEEGWGGGRVSSWMCACAHVAARRAEGGYLECIGVVAQFSMPTAGTRVG